ncbi:site-specific DNA-methyltransferase [Hymenobacter norwichensis]|uniref:site-specific DNA-methyltransferase n=1 Tax=Hymenobacter norwichensis TaxID=223903 RepID=UPI0003B76968|nr:site-specific DNA-methyltransferase [Hymenobacter norwichensis]
METLNDYLPTTPDLNAERLADLRRLWPDLFTNEGQPNPTAVQAALGLTTPAAERYAFTWSGKTAARQAAFAPTTTTLVPDAARSFQPEKGRHAIIEGDNLQVLKLLLGGYRGRVKCIYIDPPYNTGKDFVYSDNYTEDKLPYWEQTGGIQDGVLTDTNPDTHGRYHSDWLSMIYSRLLLARQLLREDGVIFLSIDDNEGHNLRKVLDDTFGEENFVGQIIWKKKTNGNNMGLIPPVHDYIICYAKSIEQIQEFGLPMTQEYIDKNFSNPDNHPDGLWTTQDLSANHKGPHFPITNEATGTVHLPAEGRYWVFNEAEVKRRIADGRIIFGKTGKTGPIQRVFLSSKEGKRIRAESWWDKHGMNEDATQQLREIFSVAKIFDHSKPSTTLQTLVKIATSKNEGDIVLDFFAGSGTTFQAVVDQNKLDGGNRQCILVQLPERTTAQSPAHLAGYHKISDLTIERAKRVVIGYGENPQPLETGFYVWRMEPSRFPAARFQPKPGQSADEQLAELKKYLAKKQATLQLPFVDDGQPARVAEILLKNGFSLNYTISEPLPQYPDNRIVRVTDQETNKTVLLALDDTLSDATVQQLSHQPPSEKFIAPERAFNTTAKWNLKMHLKDNLLAT